MDKKSKSFLCAICNDTFDSFLGYTYHLSTKYHISNLPVSWDYLNALFEFTQSVEDYCFECHKGIEDDDHYNTEEHYESKHNLSPMIEIKPVANLLDGMRKEYYSYVGTRDK